MGIMICSLLWEMQDLYHGPSTVGLRIRETLGDIDPLKKVPFQEGHKSG